MKNDPVDQFEMYKLCTHRAASGSLSAVIGVQAGKGEVNLGKPGRHEQGTEDKGWGS